MGYIDGAGVGIGQIFDDDPWIVYPSEIRSSLKSLNAFVTGLTGDIEIWFNKIGAREYPGTPEKEKAIIFKESWREYSDGYKQFQESAKSGKWGGNWDQIKRYRKELPEWRKRFEELSGEKATIQDPVQPREAVPSNIPWGTLITIGAILTGGYLLVRGVEAFKSGSGGRLRLPKGR